MPVILSDKAFERLRRQVKRQESQINNLMHISRVPRLPWRDLGLAVYRWARTRTGGIPAATYNATGGSESLGATTPGSALCDILVSSSTAVEYEIQAGKEETIFNGVQSVIGADTIIGIIRHRDGRNFVIVEDCLSGQQPILTEGETAGSVSSFPEIAETLIGLTDDVYIVDDDTSP